MKNAVSIMIMLLGTISCHGENRQTSQSSEPLTAYVSRALDTSQTKLAASEKQLLVTMLSAIATSTFTDRQHQEYWIALVGVESLYDQRARSHVGATGLGQLMPKYYQSIGNTCGMGDLAPDTINDRYINATLSACYFKYLIGETGGMVSLALVAYNAGKNSASFKRAKSGGVPVVETAGYVSKIVVKKEQLNIASEENL